VAPKKIPTKREDRTAARLYWRKADEFLRAAVSNLTERRWNAAALSAIHGAITAADAAIVLARGLRSSSQRHEDLPDLLVTSLPESATVVPHLRRVLAKKHLVEYESRLFSETEARDLVQHAERFLDWVRMRTGAPGIT
jgi:uncharacterized protein (UPF0332 family)